MADASRPPYPFDWGEAFSALPQDAPPASRWPAIAAALEALERTRRRRRIGLALAAGLCALAALPLALHLRDAPQMPSPAITAAAPAPASATPAPTPTPVDPADTVATTAPASDAETHTTAAVAASRDRRATSIQPRRPMRDAVDRAPTAVATAVEPAQGQSRQESPEESLDTLYAASAKLESLLALTRDPRVESGPAAAIAADYEAALAEIDARLAQPGLSLDAQRTLWQARVGTLESVAGFESQFRLLAAEGGRFDGALVGID
jgi:hypothetical protein